MSPIIILTIIGSVASVVSLLISAPNAKSRLIHLCYALILTFIAGGSTILINNYQIEIDKLSSNLRSLENISKNSKKIIETYSYTSDVGKNRGFILTSFALLEKHKTQFPETYIIAKELVINGLFITKSVSSEDLRDKYDEEKRMIDGAETMKALLNGLIDTK